MRLRHRGRKAPYVWLTAGKETQAEASERILVMAWAFDNPQNWGELPDEVMGAKLNLASAYGGH